MDKPASAAGRFTAAVELLIDRRIASAMSVAEFFEPCESTPTSSHSADIDIATSSALSNAALAAAFYSM
jgi:hypothetical protein